MNKSAFNQSQFDSIYPEGIENHYWTLARNRIIKHFIFKHGVHAGRLLEIGCGKGIVVDYLRKSGLDCYGVEIADVSPLFSVGDYVKVNTDYSGLDEKLKLSIETVLLFDVIEHIEDDSSFIFSIRNNFTNLKQIIISVPARSELWSNYDEYNGHYRRYSISDLNKLSSRLNIQIQKVSYFFHGLYLPIGLFCLFDKKRSTHFNPPHGLNLFINRVLAYCFYLDYIIIHHKVWGTSILCAFDVSSSSKKVFKQS